MFVRNLRFHGSVGIHLFFVLFVLHDLLFGLVVFLLYLLHFGHTVEQIIFHLLIHFIPLIFIGYLLILANLDSVLKVVDCVNERHFLVTVKLFDFYDLVLQFQVFR